MYSLSLSPEQIEFRDTVRAFVAREIKPAAIHPDRLQQLRAPFPRDLLARTQSLGLRTLLLPEDRGGAGADTLTACIVLEELAAGDVDVATALAHTIALARFLFDAAADQRHDWLTRFVADDAFHLAYAGCPEAAPGWRYHRPRETSRAGRPAAVRRGDGWWINGEVGFVANAPLAQLIAIEVDTPESVAVALLARDAAGLEVRAAAADGEAVVKWFHGSGGYVTCADCCVTARQLLPLPAGLDRYQRGLIAMLAAVNLGIGRTAFDAAIDYGKLRVQGGRPIIQHQAIGTKLADIAIHLEAARSMIWKAAWALDHPEAVSERSIEPLPLAVAARAFTAEAVRMATENAAECFGAMGVMLDMPLQKYVHDAVICLHSQTSIAANKFELAEAIAGFDARRG